MREAPRANAFKFQIAVRLVGSYVILISLKGFNINPEFSGWVKPMVK